MQSQRWAWTHRYAVPMFVASLVTFTVAVAATVAFLAFGSGGDGSGGTETTAEECVVGTWRVTSYTEDAALGTAELVSGEPVFTFAADGTGRADYPSGTEVEADTLVGSQVITASGRIVYQYQVSDQTLEFVEQDSDVELAGGADLGLRERLTLPEGPLAYTCDSETLVFGDGDPRFELQRAG